MMMTSAACSVTSAVTSSRPTAANSAASRRSVRVVAASTPSSFSAALPRRVGGCRSSSSSSGSGSGSGSTSWMAKRRMTTRRSAEMDGVAPSLTIEDDDDGEKKNKKKTPSEPEPVPNPPLRVAAGLAAAGCLESSYLAFEKLTGGDVTCPLSGCQTALTSSYSTLFGVPLSAYGAAAYGLVAALAWWGAGMAGDEEEASSYARARILLSVSTAGLAGVSTYLLYVLAGPLGGAECVYCLTSAAISFTLFAIGFSGLSPKETGRTAPALIAVYAVTVLSLSVVLGGDSGGKTNIADLKLPYAPPVIESQSTSYSRAVAKHLKDSGAKMYGAFWCSHCEDQKETFGSGADIPYVECFPDGWERGTPLATACAAAEVTGFPTWVMGDGRTKFEGEKTLEELAKASGMAAASSATEFDAASMAADFIANN